MKYTPLYALGKAVSPLLRLFFRFQGDGAARLPEGGPVIVCSNHTSMKDPVYLGLFFRRQVFYMAKAELFQNRLVSAVITALGAFPVHRGQGDSGAIHTAEDLLRDGEVLGIFLEGTRSKDGKLGKPKSGAVMLAHATGAPVLPVCITADTPDGVPKLFHKIRISCGEPVLPQELGLAEGTPSEFRRASRAVMDRIQAMRDRDLASLGLQ